MKHPHPAWPSQDGQFSVVTLWARNLNSLQQLKKAPWGPQSTHTDSPPPSLHPSSWLIAGGGGRKILPFLHSGFSLEVQWRWW